MKRNQRGFSIIELLIALVIIGALAGAAYYVGTRQNSAASKQTTTSATSTPPTRPAKTTVFDDKGGIYSFQLPDKWTADYVGTDYSMLTLKPDSFQVSGQENNWIVEIFILPMPGSFADGTDPYADFDEYKKIRLDETPDKEATNKELHINGTPVWQFDETSKDISATGPPEVTGGYQDLNYYFHRDSNKVIEVSMRVYQHASTNYLGDKINSAYDYRQYVPQFESIAKSLQLK